MASRFVTSGGTEVKAPEGLSSATDEAWTKARQQVEENKRPREERPALGVQEGGKSLYEHLQDQKAAKQEAFEEASKLRNQFRPLDDGEVDFLEGVKQKERLRTAAERKETADQLEAFRKIRTGIEQSDSILVAETPKDPSVQSAHTSTWATSKKRRKERSDTRPETIKVRKLSSGSGQKPTATTTFDDLSPASNVETGKVDTLATTESQKNLQEVDDRPRDAPKPAGGLVGYDSDSDV